MEQWGDGEHIVFHYTTVVAHEMQYLGLGSTGAVYHAVYLWAQLIKELLDDRSIGAGGGEHELSGIHWGSLYSVGQLVFTAIDEFVGDGMVETLWVFLCQVFGKHIMAC